MTKNISKLLKDFEMTEKEKQNQRNRNYTPKINNKNYTSKPKYIKRDNK